MTNSPAGPVAAAIMGKLKQGLEAEHLVVVDESHLYQEHAGSREGAFSQVTSAASSRR